MLVSCCIEKKLPFVLALRVVRLGIGGVTSCKHYNLHFQNEDSCDRCYLMFWEENELKKVCVGSQSLEQPMPKIELDPLARGLYIIESRRLLIAVREASTSLLRVLGDERSDNPNFIVQQSCSEELFLETFLSSHQNMSGTAEMITLVAFAIVWMRSAVYEDCTERGTHC